MTRTDDRLIGTTGLHRIDWRNRSAAFGIQIGERAKWGKGYGTESARLMTGYAFDTLNLHRVWLHVYEFNPAGIRAYEKVGYRREGALRQAIYQDGRSGDVLVMAVLRDEWAASADPAGSSRTP